MRYWMLLLLLLLAACAPDLSQGPRLVEDVTLPPRTLTNTRVPSNTPEDAPTATPSPVITSEVNSPLQVVTIQADFILVTPTLPPSKTPSQTPTITTTPTISPTPTMTATDTATAPIFPTFVFTPTTAPIINPLPQVCDTLWHWIPVPPTGCPPTRPTARGGVFQSFSTGPQNPPGYMFWVDFPPFGETPENDIEGDDWIYILYSNGLWEKVPDFFVDAPPAGPISYDPILDTEKPSWGWQPRRGFGLIWRNSYLTDRRIYNAIGWATMEWEMPYSSLKYYEEPMAGGTIYLNDPQENVFALFSYGGWTRYGSQSAIPPMPVTQPTPNNGWIPIPPGG